MLEGKAIIRDTDMPEAMQGHVLELAYQALDLHEVSDCKAVARHIKQVFIPQSSKLFCSLNPPNCSSMGNFLA